MSLHHTLLIIPLQEWREISEPAKDLIAHMLECNPDRRYSAQQVLEHVWIIRVGDHMI